MYVVASCHLLFSRSQAYPTTVLYVSTHVLNYLGNSLDVKQNGYPIGQSGWYEDIPSVVYDTAHVWYRKKTLGISRTTLAAVH